MFELNPNLRFGIIVARELTNTETSPQETERLCSAEKNVKKIIKPEELKAQLIIKGYRLVLENAGINPNKFVNSMEAMMKMGMASK